MPSHLHEALLLLFRKRPELAPMLLSTVRAKLPAYAEARIDSADLTDVQPAEYRADLVVVLRGVSNAPVLGIVVEVQLSPDNRKRFAWPAYVTSLRARLKCPVCLLVVTNDEAVARWARKSIDLGCGHVTPLVIGPAGIPEVTDADRARSDPELAVLSAIAHGRDADVGKAAQIALVAERACAGLDGDRSVLYVDLVVAFLSEAARGALHMIPAGYEFKSDFVRRLMKERDEAIKAAEGQAIERGLAKGMEQGMEQGMAKGMAKGMERGRVEGRAALVVRLLTVRFGPLPEDVQARIAGASIADLDAIAERLLTAGTLQETLGSH